MEVCVFKWTPEARKKMSNALEAGITGICELPDMDAGNQTQVLCKSSNALIAPLRPIPITLHN